MPTVWSSHMYYCTVHMLAAQRHYMQYMLALLSLLLPSQTLNILSSHTHYYCQYRQYIRCQNPHSMGCQTHIYFVSCHHIHIQHAAIPESTYAATTLYTTRHYVQMLPSHSVQCSFHMLPTLTFQMLPSQTSYITFFPKLNYCTV